MVGQIRDTPVLRARPVAQAEVHLEAARGDSPGGGPVERRNPASQASSQVVAPAEAGCCQVGADGSSPCRAFMSCCSASCGSEVFSTVPP